MWSIIGEALAAAVDALARVEPAELTVAQLQDLTAGLVPQLGRLAGISPRFVGELSARGGGTVPSAPGPDGAPGPSVALRHWLRELTHSSGSAAGSAVRVAADLRSLPLVTAAVVAGQVQPAQAAVLTRLVGRIDPQALAEAEPALVQLAAQRDPHSLGTTSPTCSRPGANRSSRPTAAARRTSATCRPAGRTTGC